MMWTQEFTWQGYQFSLNMDAPSAVQPLEPNTQPAPGAGFVNFIRLALSSARIAADETVRLEAELTGSHIARLYLEVFWEGPQGWLAGPVCRRELSAPVNREIGGVFHPLWDESNDLTVDWQPHLHFMVNDPQAAWVFPQPTRYLAGNIVQEYQLYANWQPLNGTLRAVRLVFAGDGSLTRVAALGTGQRHPGRTRGITLQSGGQIIPVFSWLRQDSQTASWETTSGYTQPILPNEAPIRLQSAPALPGRYQIGILALDLDGQAQRAWAPLEIR